VRWHTRQTLRTDALHAGVSLENCRDEIQRAARPLCEDALYAFVSCSLASACSDGDVTSIYARWHMFDEISPKSKL
jgi:hypothetical protein